MTESCGMNASCFPTSCCADAGRNAMLTPDFALVKYALTLARGPVFRLDVFSGQPCGQLRWVLGLEDFKGVNSLLKQNPLGTDQFMQDVDDFLRKNGVTPFQHGNQFFIELGPFRGLLFPMFRFKTYLVHLSFVSCCWLSLFRTF